MSRPYLRTELCDMLGIEYPVFSAGMGPVAGGAEPVAKAELVAAVSEAGGLGVIGGVAYSPEDLRAEINKVRAKTDKPFGVDLLLASNFLEKAGTGPTSATVPTRDLVPAETRDALRKMAEHLGIEWIEAPPPEPSWPVPEGKSYAGAQMEVLLEEKVPVFASGLGSPAPFSRALKDAGIKIVSLVGNARAARRVADGGADIVVAQGTEAGGHTGKIGTLALLPQVMDAVAPLPVVAAGGDGTVHEVVNALAGSGGALGVIPAGTANVWAGEVALPRSPERALALVASGWRAHLDLGEAALPAGRGRRRFLLMAGAGVDGSVVRAMHGRRTAKRLGGRAAFGPAIAATALGARPLPVRITAGRRELHRELWLAVCGNTRSYTGVLQLTSDARADDGALDLLLLSGAGRRRQAALIARSLRGSLHRRRAPGIDYLRRQELAIALEPGAAAPLEVQADGEPLATVHPGDEITLRALPGALVAVLPRRPTPLLARSPGAPRAAPHAGR